MSRRGSTHLSAVVGVGATHPVLLARFCPGTESGREPAFFGRPLGGAFRDESPVPGFHQPRVALRRRSRTVPRRCGIVEGLLDCDGVA